jgi:hypothetical protein
MLQATRWVTPSVDAKVMADSPFFAVVTCQAPANQTLSGLRVFAKMVPAVAVV